MKQNQRSDKNSLALIVNVTLLMGVSILSGGIINRTISDSSTARYFFMGAPLAFLSVFVVMFLSLRTDAFRSRIFDYGTDFNPTFSILPKSVAIGSALILGSGILIIICKIGYPLREAPIFVLGYFGGKYAKDTYKIIYGTGS